MKYIRRFTEIGAGDVALVGGKGANLGEMTAAGLPVPPGFCTTAEAYRTFIQQTGAGDAIRDSLAHMDASNQTEVEAQSERIRDVITNGAMPAEIEAEVREAYGQLSAMLGGSAATPVAVRSSATAEDLPTASFAGQQDTYLNVRGEDAVLEHVKRCWASLWTARAVSYRVKQGFAHEQVALAAVVQAMIESEISGIMFSANPVSGRRDEVVINASWGLGEAIVSGLVTPDTLSVRKGDGAIVSQQIASKDMQIAYVPGGGTVALAVPPERRSVPALTSEQIAQLVALSNQIENHYRAPMDMEWAYARGQFYLLQARPITTLKAVPALPAHGEYNRSMFIEIFPDPLSPIFLSVIQPLFHSMLAFTFQTLGFKAPRDVEAIATFYNQPYFHRGYFEAALRPLSPAVREQMIAQFVNPFGRHARGAAVELSPVFAGMALRLLRFMLSFPKQLPKLLARYRAEIKDFEALDVAHMPDREIVQRSQRLAFGTPSALLDYDFLMIALIGITYQTLGSLLQRYFGDESETLRSKLISGVTGNITMETNKRLWDLAESAKRSPGVTQALRQADVRAAQAELEQSADGRQFLGELQRFLREYGHREVRMDILYPTWGEDPAPVLAFVRGYLDVGASQSPYSQQTRLVKQRAELLHSVRERLRRDVRGRLLVWPIFNWVLIHTQAHTRERDTMHFELTRLFPPLRRLLLELGRRWTAQGLLAAPDDVFFLTLNDLRDVAERQQDLQAAVKGRRAEFEANRKRTAPSIIRDGQAVEAEAAPAAAGAGRYSGVAGSPGSITGVARLIRGPEEFSQLQSGEILVAPLTNPVWTPLFAIAGGLVTEVGGILSHGAIVAREYGIPAVMGVAGATQVIHAGQRITVDGNRGLVTLEGEPV